MEKQRQQRMLYIMQSILYVIFLAGALCVRASYNYAAYGDNPVLKPQAYMPFAVALAAALVFAMGLLYLGRRLRIFPEHKVVPAVLCVSACVQVAMILMLPRLPTDDSLQDLSLALDTFYRNDYKAFHSGGYLYMFPFNFSIVIYLKAILAVFPDNYLSVKAFNIVWTLLTQWMIYLIAGLLSGRTKPYGVLLLGSFYLPALLMCNYIYNDVPATFFLTASVYFFLLFLRMQQYRWLLISGICLSVGNYLRGIGVIFLIAMLLYMLIRIRKSDFRQFMAAVLILTALFVMPGHIQNIWLQESGVISEDAENQSAPVWMWIHMGINTERIGFWDNRQSYAIYQQKANYQKADSVPLYKASIIAKVRMAGFSGLSLMYLKKLFWMWTEGTYQTDRYGIGNGEAVKSGQNAGISGGYSYTTPATQLFHGNSTARSDVLWLMYAVNLLFFGTGLIKLISDIRKREFNLTLPVLVLLGFAAFYLLWEIKSRYLFPVYPLILILGYEGLVIVKPDKSKVAVSQEEK